MIRVDIQIGIIGWQYYIQNVFLNSPNMLPSNDNLCSSNMIAWQCGKKTQNLFLRSVTLVWETNVTYVDIIHKKWITTFSHSHQRYY